MPTRTRKVRLGIVGTGLAIEKLHWPALAQLTDRFEVVAFANETRPAAERFAAQAGLSLKGYRPSYHDMLGREDVEAVLIALPIPRLYPVARAALEAGKHLLCEKPTGTNLDQAREFLSLAARFPDRKVLVAENFFYRDDLRLARSLIDDGAIGRMHAMSWRNVFHLVPREGQFSSTPWRHAPLYRGGPQLDAGVHHVAQIRFLCGDVQDLQAYVQYANPTMGGPSDMTLNMHFVSHAIGSYVGLHLPNPSPDEPNEMRLYGSEGVLIVGGGPGVRARSIRLARANGTVEERSVESDGGYLNEWINFHDALVHDEPIVGTIEQSFHNMLLVMRALDSAEEHRLIEIVEAPGGLCEMGVPLWRPRGARDLFEGLPSKVT